MLLSKCWFHSNFDFSFISQFAFAWFEVGYCRVNKNQGLRHQQLQLRQATDLPRQIWQHVLFQSFWEMVHEQILMFDTAIEIMIAKNNVNDGTHSKLSERSSVKSVGSVAQMQDVMIAKPQGSKAVKHEQHSE
jgi:hypothetical protein